MKKRGEEQGSSPLFMQSFLSEEVKQLNKKY